MKERIHAVFTTNISIALLIVLIPLILLIVLIAVTYFPRPLPLSLEVLMNERMKDAVFTTNISIEGRRR